MAKLMIHKDILKNFKRLPEKVQKRVAELVEEFQANPESEAIGLHPLKEMMVDPKVRGIRKFPDGYRAIVIKPDQGDTYLLMRIDAHDRAYDWARNKRFEVHAATGVFQMFDTEELPAPATEKPAATGYALQAFTDDDLFHAGVPRPLIPAVRSVSSDGELEAILPYLPEDCRGVLLGLAAGQPLDEALAEFLVAAAPPNGSGDFSSPEAFAYNLVLVEGREELRRVIETGSLDEWRVFLHPYQRKLVTWKTTGPVSITGSAGTGKTVVLIHRAIELARRAPRARVLVTTFTRNLAIEIDGKLGRLDRDAAERIETTALYDLARKICRQSVPTIRVADSADMDDLWDTVTRGRTLPEADVRREFEQAIEPNGIEDEAGYLGAIRTGLPRLDRATRREVWALCAEVRAELVKRDWLTPEGVVHQARLALEREERARFDHVLVDEIQDFSLEALRFIRALAPRAAAPDPLCVVGDGHQRIYRHKVPLKRADINVVGRSRRLKVNYRTTEQIRSFAQGILEGVEIDDLQGGSASTVGDRSERIGPSPEVIACADEAAEAAAVADWVARVTREGNLKSHEICVAPHKDAIRSRLAGAGFKTLELKPDEKDPGDREEGIRLGALNRIKGLEFRAVALACAGPDDAMNDLGAAGIFERCARYVAATRARDYLLVVTRG